VILLVKEDVRIKRCRACDGLNDEKIRWQDNVCTSSDQKHRKEEEGRIVAFVSEVSRRDEMVFGIVGVMKVNVVASCFRLYAEHS
jgi:hypothetical protein